MVKQIEKQHWNKDAIVLHKIPNSYAMHFYGKHVFTIIDDSLQLKEGEEIQFIRFGYCRKDSQNQAIFTHK